MYTKNKVSMLNPVTGRGVMPTPKMPAIHDGQTVKVFG